MRIRVEPPRVWCFDVEARPGPWGGGDFTYKNMLSIAGGYEGAGLRASRNEKVSRGAVAYLAPGFTSADLEDFVRPIRDGALVVAHNGLKYDLPFLSGTLVKMGLQPLPPLMLHDTMRHLPANGYAYSRGLGDMCKRFGIRSKGSMSVFDWERAYDGIPEALEKLRRYNIGDVKATLALRRELINRGLLGPPRPWNALQPK